MDSTSHMGGLSESDEDGHGLDELEEQLGESVEDCLGLGDLFGSSSVLAVNMVIDMWGREQTMVFRESD